MKVEVTEAQITNEMGVVATVQLIDEHVVQVNVKQVVGWREWYDLTDAVRKVMVLMEVRND